MCNGGEFNKTAKSMYIIHEKGGLYMFELKNGGCKQSTSKMGGVETSSLKNGCLEKWGGTHARPKAAHY